MTPDSILRRPPLSGGRRADVRLLKGHGYVTGYCVAGCLVMRDPGIKG